MKDIDTVFRRMPDGKYVGCDVVKTRNYTFIRVADGTVYASSTIDIAERHGCNDIDRRAACKLRGIDFRDVRMKMTAARIDAEIREKKRALNRALDTLRRQGYKAVKA
jgi:hypothetical protein